MSADGANGHSRPADKASLPPRFTTRWHLVGAGLSNVWRFGDVEFPAPSGRLLLRGANGAGKTTALEALAPYLLDLNPARMAAGKSRTTNLNSLMREGASGRRRYGYLWLTFAESQEGPWSFGARLQYSEGGSPPVKVMPFVVPGRPLHELDMHGPNRAALSNEQFADRVAACGGEMLDEDGYVSHLAARVFGRADAKEILELASRLRQVRNPALLGEVSPGEAASALRESLPGVDEDVISATAEALAESDQTRQAFTRDSEAAEQLRDFREIWCAHVTDVVRHSHAAAAAAERDRHTQSGRVTECERALKRASANAVTTKEKLDDLDAQIAATRSEIEAIEKHDSYKEAGRLGELKKTASVQKRAAALAIEVMRSVAERSIGEARSFEQALDSIAEDLAEHQREAANAAPEARITEVLLGWTGRSRAALKVADILVDCAPEIHIHGSPARLREVARAWVAIADTRQHQSEAAALAIFDYREVGQLKAAATEKAFAARTAASAAEQEFSRAMRLGRDAREAAATLLLNMGAWLGEHVHLLEETGVPPRESNPDEIEQLVDAEPALVLSTFDSIAHQILVSAEAIAGALRTRATRASEEAKTSREIARTLRTEAEELRAGRLLPLPRPEWAGPGNNDVALGTALEWREGFDDPAPRALVEAALAAAGVLSASVGRDGSMTSRWEVRSSGPVCTESLLAVLSVDLAHPLASEANAVLARIGLAPSADQPEVSAALCIGRDGTFCAGVLHGRVPGADEAALLLPATHVGARQRRAAALKRAEQLEIEALSVEQAAFEQESLASNLLASAQRISSSARNAPSRQDLRNKESQRAAVARLAAEARIVADQAESASQEAADDFQTAHSAWIERTRSRGLPEDLHKLEELRTTGAQAAGALRRAAQPLSSKLADRLERAMEAYSLELTTNRLQNAEGHARQAHQAAADAQTQVQVLEETAGAAITEIQIRHAGAQQRLFDLLALHEPTQTAWAQAEGDKASAYSELDNAGKQLREEFQPRARQALEALRSTLQVPGVADSVLDGESIAEDGKLLEQVTSKTQGRRTLTVKTVLEKADDVRTKLAGIWSLDPGENHGELLTFVLRYRDGTYTPADAAAYAQQLKLRAEAALQASEEKALRDFVIGRLPNAIGTAWVRLHDWLLQVNRKMQSAAASSGVGIQVRVPLRDDLPPACREVYELSCKLSGAERSPEQQQQLGQALRALIESASAETMQERVAYAVDIREWVDVHYEVTRPGGTKHRWTPRTGLSGGERRLVVLAPMLAAIAAAYDRFGTKVLRFVTLDEVPAEVDERGREGLARYIAALDLDLICTSYLWDGAPGAWDGIEAYDLEAGDDGTVVAFPMLMRGTSFIPEVVAPTPPLQDA